MAPIVLAAALTTAVALVAPPPGGGSPPAAALPDRGIFSDLDAQARIAPPPWRLHEGTGWLRLDETHRVLTVYQGDAPIMAYPLVREGGARTLAEVLPLLRPGDVQGRGPYGLEVWRLSYATR